MPKLHTMEVPEWIRNGLMFPNVISIKLMQRIDGQVVVVSRRSLEGKLSKRLFTKIFNDIDLMGEYISDTHHAIIHDQSEYS